MADRPTLLRRGGPWARVVIFISLYIMLLESLTEWVLVIYLYVIKQVDSKMTPSLILALVASFFTVPLVALHSLAAWQYNRVVGFGTQKAILHASCTYILRLTVALWLAASVAGLVVASQQASCLPDDHAGGGFWNQGVSCTLHRTVVIVTVVSFVTVCIFFCSRELCDRPYDISLLGVYKQQPANRDGSIFSSTSSESENVLKNDVLCLCRHPDTTSGPYWSPMDVNFTEKPACKPSIKHPRPIHPRPLLTLDTSPVAEPPVSPNETLVTDPYPVSRSSTLLATPTSYQRQFPPPVAELSAASAAAPSTSSKPTHKRGKSSLSSLMRFIPKSQPTAASLPLSADPQIRELSDPDLRRGVENDSVTTPSSTISPAQPAPDAQPPSTSTPVESSPITHRRSMTTSSSDAPEVVPQTPKTPRPHTQPQLQLQQFSIHHPHHPNYLPYPQSRTSMPHLQPPRIPPSPSPHSPNRHPTTRRQSTTIYHFDPSQQSPSPSPYRLPRHSQSQHLPHYYHRRRMEPSRNYSYSHRLRRSNDVEVLYPSTRRPRSSIGMGSGRLDSIEEVTRGSLDENSYRGADRTSFVGI